MGMVRQWQQLLHGNRMSESYTESMPDFVKLADAYGGVGIRCEKPGDLDGAIREMLAVKDRPVLFDCRVAQLANCFPMIPSGKAHNDMLFGGRMRLRVRLAEKARCWFNGRPSARCADDRDHGACGILN